MNKTLIKIFDSYTEAISNEAYFEQIAKKYRVKIKTMVLDTRNEEDIVKAAEEFDTIIIDKGIYFIVKTNDVDKLTLALATEENLFDEKTPDNKEII